MSEKLIFELRNSFSVDLYEKSHFIKIQLLYINAVIKKLVKLIFSSEKLIF